MRSQKSRVNGRVVPGFELGLLKRFLRVAKSLRSVIAVRSGALRTIRLLIACEQLAHSSRIETAMQQLAKPVIAKALRDIGQQPQMRAVRQLRDVANLTHYPSPASPGGISATTFLMPCRAILV